MNSGLVVAYPNGTACWNIEEELSLRECQEVFIHVDPDINPLPGRSDSDENRHLSLFRFP
jgi:hypothetical protein